MAVRIITNFMYQRLAYIVHLHRPTVVVLLRARRVGKDFFCYIASVFQITIRDLVTQLRLMTDAVLKQCAKMIADTYASKYNRRK